MDSLDARALFIPRVSAYIIKAFSNWLEKVVRRRSAEGTNGVPDESRKRQNI